MEFFRFRLRLSGKRKIPEFQVSFRVISDPEKYWLSIGEIPSLYITFSARFPPHGNSFRPILMLST